PAFNRPFGSEVLFSVILSGPTALFHGFTDTFTAGGRIFDIAAGVSASISGLTLMNGNEAKPGYTGNGGGQRKASNLTVSQCLFYNNGAGDGTSDSGGGGAIYNSGTLTVIGSAFAGNDAVYGSGGAIDNAGTATVSDSTFLQNFTGVSGGAIFNDVNGH